MMDSFIPEGRYTDRLRLIMQKADEFRRAVGHNYFAAEHVMLGILAEEENAAASILRSYLPSKFYKAFRNELELFIAGKGK